LATLSASDARADLYRLIDRLQDSHDPVTITGRRNNAVMISEQDWMSIQETLYLLSIPGMRESILAAQAEPLEGSAKGLDW
jgi:prevent-host-death family protein